MNNNTKILVLCRYIATQGAVVVDSINSFVDHSTNNVFIYSSAYSPFDPDFPYDYFDVIVIHYSIIPTLRGFISNKVTDHIAKSRAKKIIMTQDEYRSTSSLVEYANRIKVDLFYSVVPKDCWGALYKDLRKECRIVSYLTGYVPAALCTHPVPAISKRKWDIVYRGRKYPRWFGGIMLKKIDMALNIATSKMFSDLRLNISVNEKDRLYGADWLEFLSNSKSVFATESDVEIVDPDGKMLHYDNAVNQLLEKNEEYLKDEIKLEASREYTEPFPGSLAVIAPRIFEAIALRTVLLMPPGHYSGILIPWIHYIPIEPDFSNSAAVKKALTDKTILVRIAARAYADICSTEQYSYKGFAESFDVEISKLKWEPDVALRPVFPEDYFSEIQKKYPFYYMPNPHGLKFHSGLVKKTLYFMKNTLLFRKLFLLFKNA